MSSNNTNNEDVAKSSTSSNATKKRRRRDLSGKTEEEKREDRLAANRKAAYNCRLRKRILIEELQRQVIEISQKNNSLEKENAQLRKVLDIAEDKDLKSAATVSPCESAYLTNIKATNEKEYPTLLSLSGNQTNDCLNQQVLSDSVSNLPISTPNSSVRSTFVDLILQRQVQASDNMRTMLRHMQNTSDQSRSLHCASGYGPSGQLSQQQQILEQSLRTQNMSNIGNNLRNHWSTL